MQPINEVKNNTAFNKYMMPWNNTLTPMGTYQLANGVTSYAVQVRIGTFTKGIFTPDPNELARAGSIGGNRTWTAAAYNNLTSKQDYAIEAALWTATGNPPGGLAVMATEIKLFTIP